MPAKTKSYRPTGDRILIERAEPVTKVGSILIPEKAQEKKPQHGFVRAVGPGKRKDDGVRLPVNSCVVGDHVYFLAFAGVDVPCPVTGDKEKFCLVTEQDIVCVVEEG